MNTCREYSKFDTFYNVIIIKNDSTYKLYQIKIYVATVTGDQRKHPITKQLMSCYYNFKYAITFSEFVMGI